MTERKENHTSSGKIKELDDGRDVCRINRGLTKVLRYGAHNTEATKICILLVGRYAGST